MPRLEWGRLHEKTYEAGVDRGVFYPMEGPGSAWPGLVSVEEIRSGIDLEEKYFDGRKYTTELSRGDFEMTISAFSAPKTFREHEGLAQLAPGVYATHQPRQPFGFSYRTLVGNAVYGIEYGYKIHLVYNAFAFPEPRTYETVSDRANPVLRKWKVNTIPYHKREYNWFRRVGEDQVQEQKTAFIPGSHFVVSTRSVHPQKVLLLEALLYGTDETDPVLPSPAELIEIMR